MATSTDRRSTSRIAVAESATSPRFGGALFNHWDNMEPRELILNGPTYEIRTPEGAELKVTINEQNGQPFEIFVQCDDAVIYQWVALATILITRLLRDGHSLNQIADEMQEIHCPSTGHYIPGTRDWCPSLIARIGRTLKQHMGNKNGCVDTNPNTEA